MAENILLTLNENMPLARDVWRMRLSGPLKNQPLPGQFLNLKVPGFYLRRPFSISRWGKGWLEVVYKTVGGGSAALAQMAPGQRLSALAGLGNGFSPKAAAGKRVLLIGGGVGTPPLLGLAQTLCAAGAAPAAALGFASAPDVFFTDEFAALGCAVHLATEDGGAGQKGFVTGLIKALSFNYYFTCGPSAMLRAVHAVCEARGIPGQLSFEERMGCGYGVCMGCSCRTKKGAARVCADGPVFHSGEVVFE